MRRASVMILAAGTLIGCQPGSEPALREPTLREASPGLLARATVPADRARAVALGRSGGGTIVEAELEEEDGALLYSYEIRLADGALMSIEVDARSGQVTSADTEEASDQADDENDDDDAVDQPEDPPATGRGGKR